MCIVLARMGKMRKKRGCDKLCTSSFILLLSGQWAGNEPELAMRY